MWLNISVIVVLWLGEEMSHILPHDFVNTVLERHWLHFQVLYSQVSIVSHNLINRFFPLINNYSWWCTPFRRITSCTSTQRPSRPIPCSRKPGQAWISGCWRRSRGFLSLITREGRLIRMFFPYFHKFITFDSSIFKAFKTHFPISPSLIGCFKEVQSS